MTPYLLIGLVAAVVTFCITPLVRWFTVKIGAIDHPSDRKVHAEPTPTLGGIAIFIALVVAGVVARLFIPEFKSLFVESSEAIGILAGATIIFFLGVVDDVMDLPAPAKLAGQIFASGVVFLFGVKFKYVLLPNNAISLSDDVSVLITVLWLVAMVNAVNLIDGLDGLAAGIVAIAAASFFVFTFNLAGTGAVLPGYSAPLIAISIVGAALGFLRHNFHPARIFMGDSGAMLLGLVLGATTVAGVGSAPPQPEFSSTASPAVFLAYFPLLIPLMVVAIPLIDALFAIVRRTRKRRSVFHADKEHLHHRLMDLGHGHRQAVIVMYLWSALAAGAALAFTFLERDEVTFALPIAVGAIVLYTLFPVLTRAVEERL